MVFVYIYHAIFVINISLIYIYFFCTNLKFNCFGYLHKKDVRRYPTMLDARSSLIKCLRLLLLAHAAPDQTNYVTLTVYI